MLICEYRIVLPISVEEYQVGQLYAVIEASKNETGGGDGVEVIVNEPYEENGEKGQFTHKVYHLSSKVPRLIKALAPNGSLEVHEKAWNAYPYCRTIITNPFMKDDFLIKIETWHKPDLGREENVHQLPAEQLNQRKVVNIDIVEPPSQKVKDYKKEYDPTLFKSTKTNRGPLKEGWQKDLASSGWPYMCAYKLVTIKFKWRGLQSKIEAIIEKTERRIFANFHRQLFCTLDDWIGLDMNDIRRLEEITKKELDEKRLKDGATGMSVDD
ncbi:phosphatidylinositol transfer protein alpha isoform-like [Synchiropus splendidus]|uniref:phosphatidylinositol transfer protein alpha isoform-like n=1 Tax=Synchiropus splendidus TaxID=270530 RepID=UPI00237E43A6|nr:phosphatidylinositol transfer protein alpha isoform-like [Synchiropus splendidus]